MSKIKVPADLVSGESSLLTCKCPLSVFSHHFFFSMCACGERKICLLLIKALILLNQGSTLMTSFNLNYHQKNPISKYSHIGLQYMNSGGTQFSP